MSPNPTHQEARFAYEGLDRVIHERARLSVLTSLISHPAGLSFVDLKGLCGLTDGNLARHLQVLETEGMVRTTKDDSQPRTQTILRITPQGRKRFVEYLSILEKVVKDAATADQPLTRKARPLATDH